MIDWKVGFVLLFLFCFVFLISMPILYQSDLSPTVRTKDTNSISFSSHLISACWDKSPTLSFSTVILFLSATTARFQMLKIID